MTHMLLVSSTHCPWLSCAGHNIIWQTFVDSIPQAKLSNRNTFVAPSCIDRRSANLAVVRLITCVSVVMDSMGRAYGSFLSPFEYVAFGCITVNVFHRYHCTASPIEWKKSISLYTRPRFYVKDQHWTMTRYYVTKLDFLGLSGTVRAKRRGWHMFSGTAFHEHR